MLITVYTYQKMLTRSNFRLHSKPIYLIKKQQSSIFRRYNGTKTLLQKIAPKFAEMQSNYYRSFSTHSAGYMQRKIKEKQAIDLDAQSPEHITNSPVKSPYIEYDADNPHAIFNAAFDSNTSEYNKEGFLKKSLPGHPVIVPNNTTENDIKDGLPCQCVTHSMSGTPSCEGLYMRIGTDNKGPIFVFTSFNRVWSLQELISYTKNLKITQNIEILDDNNPGLFAQQRRKALEHKDLQNQYNQLFGAEEE